MVREQEAPEWMESFLSAVYPDYTHLCVMIARKEEQVLKDATAAIQESRRRNAKLESALREFIEHEQLSMCDGCAPDNIQCSCGPCRSIDIVKKAREVLGE